MYSFAFPYLPEVFYVIGREQLPFLAVLAVLVLCLLLMRRYRKSVRRYRCLFESSLEGIVVLKADGKVCYANSALERCLGLKSGGLVGKDFFYYVYKEDVQALRSFWVNAMQKPGAAGSIEFRMQRPDSSMIYVETFINNLLRNAGVKGVVVTARDVTERKRHEEARRFSNEILNRVSALILAGDSQGRITYLSPSVETILGYKPTELLGDEWWNLTRDDPTERKLERDYVARCAKGEIPVDETPYERALKRKDGKLRRTLWVDAKGPGGLLIGVGFDITESKKAELTQTHTLEQLESAARELRNFEYVVSHDLLASLHTICSVAARISMDYSDKLGEDGQEQVDLLLDRIRRMHDLCDRVLEYSSLQQTEEKKVELNLNEMVREVIDKISPQKNLEIKFETALPSLLCEKSRMEQIFYHLLNNSIAFMDKPRGEIKIACIEEDHYWRFSIADNGPGINEKYRDRIFQLLRTVSPEDKDHPRVGLSIVRKIIELYGGKIWVESAQGEGSTFFFTFPKG